VSSGTPFGKPAQILVARRHDPDVGLDRGTAADGGVFALLQHAQQPCLRFHRHVADFVEKQRAAFGPARSGRKRGYWRR
jgi:hypothetical protein